MRKSEKFDKIAETINEFEENCNPTYLDIVDITWDTGASDHNIVPEIHVTVEDTETAPPETDTYCRPVADFGREHGLFLWDTVTDWEERTVRLRFRFKD